MKIERARVIPIALPLRAPIVTAHGSLRERRGTLLVLETACGLAGLGEAAPIPGFGGEPLERSREALAALAARALGADPRAPDPLLDAAEAAAPDAPCARAALDSALHDLAARAAGAPLATWLAARGGADAELPVRAARTRVEASALLAARAPTAAAAEARRAVAAGFTCLKLKVGAGPLPEDAARLRAIRAAVGSAPRIRLDANGAWPDAATALAALGALAGFGIELVEQPVPAADVGALAAVRGAGVARVAADEAVGDAAALERVLAAGAADAIVLKPAVLGGLRAARRAAARAHAAGCALVVTTVFDGAVGRAGALALAASLPDPLLACGLATGGVLADDVAAPERVVRGALAPPDEPGLGVSLDPAALARVADGRARLVTRHGEQAA